MSFVNFTPLHSSVLKELADDHSLLLVAYGFTNPEGIRRLKDAWNRSDSKNKALGRTTEETRKVEVNEVGGAITLFNLNIAGGESEVLADVAVTTPMGLCYWSPSKELLVGSAYSILAIRGGVIVRTLNNNLFNQVHAITLSERGIYAACTATDSVVEIDPEHPERNLWDWIAPEHGLSTTKSGQKRNISRAKNYQLVEDEGSRNHTTHVNGVEAFDGNHVLATLFHQDSLIKISKSDGSYATVLSGVVNAHGIHRTDVGFMVSDTRGGRVVLLDKNLLEVGTIKGDFDWVQDAVQLDEYYVVANDNKGRLEIFSHDYTPVGQVAWDPMSRKVSALCVVKAGDMKEVF